jgi:hypothetical protein
MYNIDKKVFDENLLITQTYCEMQLTNTDKPVAEILRSFNPEYNGKRLVIYRSSLKVPVEWSIDPFDKENKYLFKDLFENQLSHKIKEIKELAINKQINGAVLVVEVYNSQMDGGATAYSEGLFDLYDWPPIDTWFYYLKSKDQDVLFAWIPEKFIELIDEGIAVGLNDYIYWLDDWEIKNDRFIQETLRYTEPRKNFIQRNPFILSLIIGLGVILLYISAMAGC